ncbi:probable leucine-rich repeat receptor-like protein kinase At5g63930 [Durio zibethinus]|uniref:Probable leucine-rich repeat receptor-like protein kinase At5g63930 n=1 Tax=Durio zibethinus TaxID=66656 RepID=A0A6P5WLB2_DURZI|nr:probable leucine-rich repeat receptor-like protein kinase At5g63930 [Durio zibethinus]
MDDFKRVGTIVFSELLCLSVLVITTSFCNAISDAACLESERQALLRFKQGLIDPSDLLASWSNGGDCCDWTRVICDNLTGHVVELHLGNIHDPNYDVVVPGKAFERSRLSGKLDSSLLDLKHLQYLDLSGNNFGGQIPGFLGSLQSLRYLNLSTAGFEGLIPPQLGNLTNLRYLDLHDPLSVFLYAENLQWLTSLARLQLLDLSGISISKATDWLQVTNSLPSLIVLRLSYCQLDPAPPLRNVNFSSLGTLDLSYNKFSNSIFSWIFGLNSLVSLDLSQNSFQGHFPHGLRNMSSLRYLSLASNQFNSSIPNWLYGLNHLQYLDLGFNNLQGTISEDVGNLTSAISLDFAYSKLAGAALRSLGNLCSLRTLVLSGVRLSQNISEVLDSLSGCLSDRLESLFLAKCELSGHVNNQLGRFKSLRDLYMSKNSISGPFPDSIRSLTSLKAVDLSENLLNGTFPEWLGQLRELEILWIGKNLLQGVVSEVHFSNVTRLRLLQASGNQFSLKVSPGWVPPFQLGVIALSSWNLGPSFPHWLRFQKDFVFLDISVSGIVDTIPDWFWNLSTQFFYLNLSHNQIQGKIPEKLNTSPPLTYPSSIDLNSNYFEGSLPCLPSNVDTLDLSNNSFSGPISPFLCCKMDEPKNLGNLRLADNHLSGPIPDCWMSWPSVFSINLKNNNLSGSLPNSMGSLSLLQSLHLRKNNLSGVLPPSLQNCSSLLALDLSENKFEGSIPSWIGEKLSNIMIVSLRSNNFQGDIPHKLCALSYLTILDLAHNNLSGKIPKCFTNFSAMASKRNSSDPISYAFGHFKSSIETTLVVIKGILLEYSSTLRLVTSMDLSDNNLSGEIPAEITNLFGLRSLNLSTNGLTGRIPETIGNMGTLESLDFSFNQLSGAIPPSISNLTFLSYFHVAYNNLSGKIPLSTQLQSFDALNFAGNNLCGPPLTDNCSINGVTPGPENREDSGDGFEVDWVWFSVSMALGFVVAFWSFAGPLLFNRSWRSSYFHMLDSMGKKIRGVFSNNV